MMSEWRIGTLNLNGLRAASQRGFLSWMADQDIDVWCLQEVRMSPQEWQRDVYDVRGFSRFASLAQRPGYAGVAIYSRPTPSAVACGLGWPEFDTEGRCILANSRTFQVCSLYLPSGTSAPERQAFKLASLARVGVWMQAEATVRPDTIFAGDWNMARCEQDIRNWRGNRGKPGFSEPERAWLQQLFGPGGFIDAQRALVPDGERYTWWSYRSNAWARDAGWRIDYQVISARAAWRPVAVAVYREQRFSDHAPLLVRYTAVDV